MNSGQALLDQPREEACAVGQGLVVEVVRRVVHLTQSLPLAIADVDVATRHFVEHVREVFRGHDERRVATYRARAGNLGTNFGGEVGFLWVVDQRCKDLAKVGRRAGAEASSESTLDCGRARR